MSCKAVALFIDIMRSIRKCFLCSFYINIYSNKNTIIIINRPAIISIGHILFLFFLVMVLFPITVHLQIFISIRNISADYLLLCTIIPHLVKNFCKLLLYPTVIILSNATPSPTVSNGSSRILNLIL